MMVIRILFDNGTLIYKLTNMTEETKISYGTINKHGVISLLPNVAGSRWVGSDLGNYRPTTRLRPVCTIELKPKASIQSSLYKY